MPSRRKKPSLAEWVSANVPHNGRQCRLCSEPGKGEMLAQIIRAMAKQSVQIGLDAVGAKLAEDLGGKPVWPNSIRSHLLRHDPKTNAVYRRLVGK